MPTHDETPGFIREYRRLTQRQQDQFRAALILFIECLRTRQFEPSLRVKTVKGWPGIWEMTWADDGRATFSYGAARMPGEAHIIWRRIGTHDIFKEP